MEQSNRKPNNKRDRINANILNRQELREMEQTEKSRAKRIKTLLKKRETLLKKKYETVEFKSPVVFLMRNNGKTDFYEDATVGEWKFTHTNGEEKKVILDPSLQTTFNYGKTAFKGYIIQEDEKLPYPHNPLIYAQQWEMYSDKMLNDIRKHKAEEYKGMGSLIMKIAMAIALIIGVLAVANMVGFNVMDIFGGKEEVIVEKGSNVLKNMSEYVLG